MDRAAASTKASNGTPFRDGIGERRVVLEAAGQAAQELLCIRGELSAVPAFEFALRERVSRLASFRHAYYAQIRSVERLSGPECTLGVLSDHVDGVRLSDLLTRAAARGFNLDINAAICLIRQLVPAVARLHESSRDMAHAALGPERVVVTPQARLVITEYALGSALEQLRFSQERYWKDLRVALPRSAGLPHFDQRADVTQLGVVALSLILGRLLRDDEYPSRVGDVVASAWAVSPKGGFEPLPPGIRGWLGRALQLDMRNSFANAVEASADFDRVLGDSEYIGLPASLESFLARYHAAEAIEVFTSEQAASAEPQAIRTETARPPQPMASTAAATAPAPGLPSDAPVAVAPAAPTMAAAAQPSPALTRSFFDDLNDGVPPSAADELQSLAASVAAPRKATIAQLKTPVPIASPDAGREIAVLTPSFVAKIETARALDPLKTVGSLDGLEDEDEAAQAFGKNQRPKSRWPMIGLAIGGAVVVLVAIGVPLTWSLLAKPAPVATMGTLAITTNPPGATAVIDGKPSGTTPVTLSLIAGSHTVEIRGDGEPRSIPVTIPPGGQLSQYIELPKAAPVVGQLSVRSEPAGAMVTVDGIKRGATPTIVTDLSPGDHQVVLDSDAGSVKQTVTIESGVQASLSVPMGGAAAAQASGWLGVNSPFELQIREGEKVLGTSLSDRIMLPAGKHNLELVNETLGYRTQRSVQIVIGKTAALKVDVPRGTIALNAVPWADVWLDGERIGETPIGNLAVPIGVHDVVLRHPEFGEQHHQLIVPATGVARLSVDLRKK